MCRSFIESRVQYIGLSGLNRRRPGEDTPGRASPRVTEKVGKKKSERERERERKREPVREKQREK